MRDRLMVFGLIVMVRMIMRGSYREVVPARTTLAGHFAITIGTVLIVGCKRWPFASLAAPTATPAAATTAPPCLTFGIGFVGTWPILVWATGVVATLIGADFLGLAII